MTRRLAAALLSLLLAGCGSLCTRAEATATSFTDKALPCGSTGPTPRFDRMACEASMGACTAEDTQRLWDYLDCLDALPTCEPKQAAAFSAAVLACAAPMSGMSAGCFAQ